MIKIMFDDLPDDKLVLSLVNFVEINKLKIDFEMMCYPRISI